VKTHPIKHDTSFTYPKICINQTSPFWKQLRRCRHPPTTSNDPSPSGYCASTSTLALKDSRRHIQSNTILPSHTPKYASIKHRHFGSDCGAAAIHPQRQTIPHHQATMPPLLFSRKLLENSQRHIQSSASLPAHTSIKHCHFGSWAKSLTALVQDLPAVCASVYHQLSNQGGGPTTVDLTPSPHRIRWMTEASFQPQGGLLTRQQEALLP
jgi:hypothetical protein